MLESVTYRTLSTLSTVLFAALSGVLVACPEVVYWLFGLEAHELGDFLAKRAGMLFAGFSLLCFQSRSSETAEVQRLVSASIGLAMGTMAILGIFEWARGSAGAGIWVAIVVECMVSALYFRIWRHSSSPSSSSPSSPSSSPRVAM